jgi:predicted transcriptional regulator
MNNTTKPFGLQQLTFNNPFLYFNQFDPTPCKAIKENVEQFPDLLTKYEINIFNLMLWFQILRPNVSSWMSQQWIADKVGCDRRTVIRAMKKFQSLGIIAKDYRHEQTCRYKVSSYFFLQEVKDKLYRTFSNLAFYSCLLLTIPNEAFNDSIEKNVTQSYLFKFKITVNGKLLRARACGKTDINENNMNNNSYDGLLTPELRQLTDTLGLTKTGQIKLMAYPVEALRHALKSINLIASAMKPFEYLCKLCNLWCSKNNKQPQWSHVQLIFQTYQINEEDSKIDKSKIKLKNNNKLISDIHTLQTCSSSGGGNVTQKDIYYQTVPQSFSKIYKPFISPSFVNENMSLEEKLVAYEKELADTLVAPCTRMKREKYTKEIASLKEVLGI